MDYKEELEKLSEKMNKLCEQRDEIQKEIQNLYEQKSKLMSDRLEELVNKNK